jgi:hypothetical protein
MVYVIPKSEIKLEDVITTRQVAAKMLTDLISARGKKPEAYVVRDILPKTDLGLTNEEWKISYSSAYTWEKKIDFTLPEDKFIVFFGFHNNSADPKTLAVKFYKDVTPVEVIEVENLYTYAEPIGFFTPLAWGESEGLKVEFYGKSAGDDYPVLRGLVAELRKKTIA